MKHWLKIQKYFLFMFLGVMLCSLLWFRLPPRGLQANYYDNPEWKGQPVVSKLEKRMDLATVKFGLFYVTQDTWWMKQKNFSIVWQGWILVDRDGIYDFVCESDSKAFLFIDRTPVINNEGAQYPETRKVRQGIFLTRGMHQITVRYSQGDATYKFVAEGRSLDKPANKKIRKRLAKIYHLSIKWTPPNGSETPITSAYLYPRKLSKDLEWLSRNMWLAYVGILLALGGLAAMLMEKVFPLYVRSSLFPLEKSRISEILCYLVWCFPAGLIFLGYKGVFFGLFLYLTGRPISVFIKKTCFALERVTFSITISLILFLFLFSWLLHFAAFHWAFIMTVCVYSFSALIISFFNWKQNRKSLDSFGSKRIYVLLIAVNLFLCLVSANLQRGWEQATFGYTLTRIVNHDYDYFGHKYGSILFDALVYTGLIADEAIVDAEMSAAT